jgi:NTP pyrophosphatase (non-canonical NTP hydrolase)
LRAGARVEERKIVISETTHQPENADHQQVAFADFQQLIRNMYLQKDLARGIDGTFMWFMEEVGELAAALRDGSHDDKMEEFADVIAWLTTMANVVGVDLSEAVTRKYGSGCPGCGHFVCTCSLTEKP